MKILIVGGISSSKECREKFGASHSYTHVENHDGIEQSVSSADVIFNFVHDSGSLLNVSMPVFYNSTKISLAERFSERPTSKPAFAFGFNGMPTLFNREMLEVSVFGKADEAKLKKVMEDLNTDFQIVEDRVGMVTPRVICINEAYFTVQEKTASREDIDVAMKLGTNYPFGPFEWCQRIGIKNVYELLEAMYDDTHDERYKICLLLKREYLMSK
jgi:3-hydroxybutyryl-CoA dehydrogenase